jgi:hypothetical protein
VVCVVLFVGGIVLVTAGVVGSVFAAIESSEPYQIAMERARTDEAVVERLGQPIEPGSAPSGKISKGGASGGTADLAIPVSGPQGTGTVYVVATQTKGVWAFSTLALVVTDSGERIDLLGAEATSPAPHASADSSGVTIQRLALARDDGNGEAGEEVTRFKASDRRIHVVAELSDFKDGVEVKVALTAVSAGGAKGKELGDVSVVFTSFDNVGCYYFTWPRDWPVGTYRVDAFLDGKLTQSLEFDVVA